MNTEKEFFRKDITKDILDSAFKVHNALGCGLLEKVYGNGLCWDLELKGRGIVQQKEFRVLYRDKEIGIYYADIVVDGKVTVEVKSVERLDDVHRAQLLNYLRLSSIKVGLLINFSKTKLEYERLVV
jgi:GxxExxY protein